MACVVLEVVKKPWPCWLLYNNHWPPVLQGEEVDSSDEEWATAYATMDPISQLGWRNRRLGVEGPASQLMRDVFDAADAIHSDAMSEMVASRDTDDDGSPVNAPQMGEASVSPIGNGSQSPTSSEEVDQEGEPWA